ncbi:uncharacterized protein LOC125292554 [Alosa alosa]|nr:uncharacterized protein LOC125292554 [Alosa alosa]
MVATTGHRKCIFLGMTVGDVEKAEAYKGSFTITVPLHKTVKTFGAAKVCIGKDLFKNLKDFSTLRPSLRGYDKAETLFFNSTGHEMTRMGVFVGRMWGECGLPGTPTLKDIRTAISTHTDVALPFDKRQGVCRAMAHDPKTASLYYVPEASGRQTRTIRLDILRSLMASVKQRKRVSEETQDQVTINHSGDGEDQDAMEQDQETNAEVSEEGQVKETEVTLPFEDGQSQVSQAMALDLMSPGNVPEFTAKRSPFFKLEILRSLSRSINLPSIQEDQEEAQSQTSESGNSSSPSSSDCTEEGQGKKDQEEAESQSSESGNSSPSSSDCTEEGQGKKDQEEAESQSSESGNSSPSSSESE